MGAILISYIQDQGLAKSETQNYAYQVDAQKNNHSGADDDSQGEDKEHDSLVLGGALVAGVRRAAPVPWRAHTTVCGLGGGGQQASATHDSP